MLQEYKRKRDFKITPEPSGLDDGGKSKASKAKSLTFVIQKHDASHLHYDFRLEIDGVMVSWAVPKGPSLNPQTKRLAMMTEDHPMKYSDFEGVIPAKQYGAGEVIIWDRGVYSPDEDQQFSWTDKAEANKRMRAGLKKGKLSFHLKGDKLEGSWTLVKMHGKDKEWLLIKHHDEFEDSKRDVTELDASVVSGKTLQDMKNGGADRKWAKGESVPNEQVKSRAKSIVKAGKVSKKSAPKGDVTELLKSGKKAAFPNELSPMLATLVDQPFTLDGWFFEPKLDGVRAVSYIKNGKVKMLSRNGLELSGKYPDIHDDLENIEGNFVLDGEVVAFDANGKVSFQHLQQNSNSHLVYYVFDILYADGKSLVDLPLLKRKQILKALIKPSALVKLVDSLGNDGELVFQACVENGLEGIVGKLENSKYLVGKRSKSWLKVKTNITDEFLICGYTEGTGSRLHTFGSLLLGEHDKEGNLQFVGGVGTGFDNKKLDALLKRMKPLEITKCPFKKKPPGKLNPTWVEPELVVEIKYLERTHDNILRAPVYMHLREDIEPDNVKPTKVVHIEREEKAKPKKRKTAK